MERTTNLELLIDGAKFTWGHVVKIHEIGPYVILEYIEWTEGENGRRTYRWDENGVHFFHVYVDDKDRNMSAKTLESAMAHAMAVKWDGDNSQAGYFFCKMIGVS